MDSRPAHITPSGFHKVLTGSRGGDTFGKTAESYAYEIVQRMIGVEIDDYVSKAMEWGIQHEASAIVTYEDEMVKDVGPKSRVVHPEYEYISGEPDGFIGEDGILEIKCPNSNNHFKNLLNGEQVEKYTPQMQGYLWVTGRSWCDFVSYDPRYPEKYQLYVQRIERDDDFIQTLEERCIKFWHELVIPIKEEIHGLT